MLFKRTIFSTEINGVKYVFAERTMREIETLVAQETTAFESHEFAKLKQIHYAFVLASLNDVPDGEKVTLDDLLDIGGPTFSTLYAAILGSQGIKLEAKNLGERLPS